MGAYAVIFFATLIQGWMLTVCALFVGRWLRILDFPDKQRKLHARATPRTGGLALCAAFGLGVAESCFLPIEALGEPHGERFISSLLLSAALLCGLGLWDDKYGMRARSKLLWQVLAVLPFVLWGRSTTTADLFGWHLDFAWLAVPVILFWLVSCTNFVNLVDGLDGLAGSVGLIVSLTVATLAWWHQLSEVCLMASILSGALVGFLIFNWPPARIFLGDSGSLPLGFLVGALSLEASAKKAAGLTLAVPVVLLSIPIFDTSMAILRRKLNGRKIGQGDRAHIHHCLRDRGWSPTQTLLLIAGMCSLTAAAAVLAMAFNNDLIAIAICLGLLATLIAGRLFGFNETVLLLRHIEAVGKFIRSMPRLLRARFVVVRLEATVAAGQLDLWHKIVKRAKRVEGLDIEFCCEHVVTGRELIRLNWRSPHRPESPSPVWELHYKVTRGGGLQTRIRATSIAINPAGLVWMNELSGMLAALCDNWPVESAQAMGSQSRPDLAGAEVATILLPERNHRARDESSRSAPGGLAGSDAA